MAKATSSDVALPNVDSESVAETLPTRILTRKTMIVIDAPSGSNVPFYDNREEVDPQRIRLALAGGVPYVVLE